MMRLKSKKNKQVLLTQGCKLLSPAVKAAHTMAESLWGVGRHFAFWKNGLVKGFLQGLALQGMAVSKAAPCPACSVITILPPSGVLACLPLPGHWQSPLGMVTATGSQHVEGEDTLLHNPRPSNFTLLGSKVWSWRSPGLDTQIYGNKTMLPAHCPLCLVGHLAGWSRMNIPVE